MNRRHFLLGLAAAMAKARFSFASDTPDAGVEIALWKGVPPGGGGPKGSRMYTSSGALHTISITGLTMLAPSSPNGRAVLIAAGGGYKRIQNRKEAIPAARWLNARGFTAYILNYRLPAEGWNDGNLVALQDAQRALRIIRQREKHVSVLGFSAGGHLMGMTATRFDYRSYPARDEIDKLSARPDGAALIYPVITLQKPYTHTSTHRILVGPHASAAEEYAGSVQNYVTATTPPCFIVQAEDDPLSDPHNSLIMAEACREHGVPVEMHRYPTGGHGFGMGKRGTETVEWPDEYGRWLRG